MAIRDCSFLPFGEYETLHFKTISRGLPVPWLGGHDHGRIKAILFYYNNSFCHYPYFFSRFGDGINFFFCFFCIFCIMSELGNRSCF